MTGLGAILLLVQQLLVRIEFAGDFSLGRRLGPAIAASQAGGREFFRPLRRHLREADFALANLEGAIRETATGEGRAVVAPLPFPHQEGFDGRYDLGFDQRFSDLLAESGFHAFGLANNHSLDAGDDGLETTRRRLRELGCRPVLGLASFTVKTLGFSILAVDLTPKPRRIAASAPLRGAKLTLGAAQQGCNVALPASCGSSEWSFDIARKGERERLLALVRRHVAASPGRLLFLFFHGGEEDSTRVLPREERFFEELFAAGVAGIFGHHAHRMKPGRFCRGKPLFPGLGSVLFDRRRAPDCFGLLVRGTFWAGISLGWELFPVHIQANGFRPVVWPRTWLERQPWRGLFPPGR